MDPNLCFEYQQLMSRYRNVTDKQQKQHARKQTPYVKAVLDALANDLV